MSKHDEGGDGFDRRPGRSGSGESAWTPDHDGLASSGRSGAPGKRTTTQSLGSRDPASMMMARLNVGRGQVRAARSRYLPALRDAIADRQLPQARTAAMELRQSLSTIDRALDESRQSADVLGSSGSLALVDDLAAQRDVLVAEVAPVLALAPAPAPSISRLAPMAMHLDAAASVGLDEAAQGSLDQWHAKLDDHETSPVADPTDSRGDNVIDASRRFARNDATDSAEPDSGKPVPAGVRGRLEAVAGTSLGGVRLHDSSAAHSLASSYAARAVTIGQDIHFAEGELDDSGDGEHLLAHEVAHTVQQRSGAAAPACKPAGTTAAADPAEVEADQFADAFVAGHSAAPIRQGLGEVAALKRRGASAGGPAQQAVPLVIAPDRLSFPRTAVGAEAAPQTVVVVNTGIAPVAIEDVLVTTPGLAAVFPTYADTTANERIEPGRSVELQFAFRPGAVGHQSTSYGILTDGGVRSGVVQLEGTAFSNEQSEAPVLVASPKRLKMAPTGVGDEAAPVTLDLANRGDQPVTIEQLNVRSTRKGSASEFIVYGEGGQAIEAGDSTELQIGFRPEKAGVRSTHLDVIGNQGARLASVSLKGKGLSPSDARHQEALHGSVSATSTYDDMLAALGAARKFTEQGDDVSYRHAHDVLDPVVNRMGGLAPQMEAILKQYGAANVAGLTLFGEAHWVVKEWWYKLDLGASINADYYVTVFRAAEEEIKLGTREIEDSADLRALQDAGITSAKVVGVVSAAAVVLPLAASAAPILLAEGALMWESAGWLGSRLGVWALANPQAAVVLGETLVGTGIQVGEGGWDSFAEQFKSGEGMFFWLMQVLMDAGQLAEASDEGSVKPRAGQDGADDVTPPTRTPATDDAPGSKPGARGKGEGKGKAEVAKSGRETTPQAEELAAATVARAKAAIEEIEAAVRGKSEDDQVEVPAPESTTTQQPRSNRVTEPVDGLYDSIDPNHQPEGWRIKDRGPPHEHPDHPELRRVITDVWAPDGSYGYIDRSFDAETKTLVMENAFLDQLPGWIDTGVPLKPGKGTPTVAYLTMRQMKRLAVQFGGLNTIKMSTIQNVRAVMELEQMKRQGMTLDEAVGKTHSVGYASTSIQQSGHEVTNVRIDTSDAFMWKLDDMMEHFRMGQTQRDALFAKYGLNADDQALANYDIYIDVAPHAQGSK